MSLSRMLAYFSLHTILPTWQNVIKSRLGFLGLRRFHRLHFGGSRVFGFLWVVSTACSGYAIRTPFIHTSSPGMWMSNSIVWGTYSILNSITITWLWPISFTIDSTFIGTTKTPCTIIAKNCYSEASSTKSTTPHSQSNLWCGRILQVEN